MTPRTQASPRPSVCPRPPRRLNVWSLASGSSGNCYLVQSEETAVLVDAGLSMRTMLDRAQSVGVEPASISAVLVTHEHGDHMVGAAPLARKLKIPIIANAQTLSEVLRLGGEAPTLALGTGGQVCWRDLDLESFAVHHDAVAPVGYRIGSGGRALCFLTDTGHLCGSLRQRMAGCDLVILESNHDVDKLLRGPYAPPLKQRVLSDTGHLSNDAASGTVADVSLAGHPTTVWLAHLSATNNTPRIALQSARLALRDGDPASVRVGVALRDRLSLCWRAEENWWQPSLF